MNRTTTWAHIVPPEGGASDTVHFADLAHASAALFASAWGAASDTANERSPSADGAHTLMPTVSLPIMRRCSALRNDHGMRVAEAS